VAAGSAVGEDVPAGALGITRAPHRNVEGWTARRRAGTASAEAAARADEGSDAAAGEQAGNPHG
jgi:bifunctional UDP-N-acetylglucosamine pyrophosphorylase/glucosamine-1-phosphate N-acetyltransferase